MVRISWLDRSIALAALVSVFGLAAGPASAARPQPLALGLIVKLKSASTEREQALSARQRLDEVGWRNGHVYGVIRQTAFGAHVLHDRRLVSADEAKAQAELLRKDPSVEWVVVNSIERRLATAPNDPGYALQWWLGSVDVSNAGSPNFPAAWDVTKGDSVNPVVVAVVDTGVRLEHPDLVGRLKPGYDFVSEVEFDNDGQPGQDNNPEDPGDWVTQADISANPALFSLCQAENSSWHGTLIAGQIAAATDNGIGVSGSNWYGAVVPVRVAGKCGAAVSDIIEGVLWSAGIPYRGSPTVNPNPARVINLSFGGDPTCDPNGSDPNDAGIADLYLKTINVLKLQGAVLVAAAGNESGPATRPANCPGALAVAALNQRGFKAGYSNFVGPNGIATVGGEIHGSFGLTDSGIYSTTNSSTTSGDLGFDTYTSVEGTSFATPIVSGTLALMLSVNRLLSPDQMIAGIEATARPHLTSYPGLQACSSNNPLHCVCDTQTCGAGILDAAAAVAWAKTQVANFHQPSSPPSTDFFVPDRVKPSSAAGGAVRWPWLLMLAAGVICAAWIGRRRV